jgi:hypothetical protein
LLRGLLFEPGLAAWVAEQRGRALERDVFCLDDAVPFFGGSIDAVEEGGEVIHEFTTTTTRGRHLWGVPGTDDCAHHKWAQAQWYMGVEPRFREAHVWCFVVDGDEEPLHYIVPRNDGAIAAMRERCESFWWDHVVARVPPPGGASDALDVLHPRANGKIVEATPDLIAAAHRYAVARDAEKSAKDEKDEAAGAIKAALGDDEGARWSGGSISWKEREMGEKVSWEEVAHQVALRSKMPGEVFNEIVREQTMASRSVRALRVTVQRER